MISYYQHLPITRNEAMISLTVHLCRHPDQGHLLTTELSSATHRSFISSNNHPVCLLGTAPLVNYQYIQQPNCLTINYPTTIQLSKYPTIQLLNHQRFKWGLNNILRLLSFTILSMVSGLGKLTIPTQLKVWRKIRKHCWCPRQRVIIIIIIIIFNIIAIKLGEKDKGVKSAG